jgi:hypothetical protein
MAIPARVERVEQNQPIYMVAGSKGGVGKSMTSLVVIDHLLDAGQEILFLETDTSNPDVWRCLEQDPAQSPGVPMDGVVMHTLKLEEADGWIDMINLIDHHKSRIVVMNTAARTGDAITKYGGILRETLPELGRRLVTLWLINRQRDSMDQLNEHMKVFPESVVHVIRNGYFGDEPKFELYNHSKLRETIEDNGGLSLTLPDLADRVADTVYSESWSLSEALRQMPIGNRAELIRWRSQCKQVFGKVLA